MAQTKNFLQDAFRRKKVNITVPRAIRTSTEFAIWTSDAAYEDQTISITDDRGTELIRIIPNGQILFKDEGGWRVLWDYERGPSDAPTR